MIIAHGAFLLQVSSFLSETSWVSLTVTASVVTGTVIITRLLTKIRGDLDDVTKQASQAKETIDRVARTQAELGQQLLLLTNKVSQMLNNHVSRTEMKLWILRFKVANPGFNVPDFPDSEGD